MKKLSEELNKVLKYINEHLCQEFPTNKITIPHLIVGVLQNEDCLGYKALAKIAMTKNIEAVLSGYRDVLAKSSYKIEDATFDMYCEINPYLEQASTDPSVSVFDEVNSGVLLGVIIANDPKVQKVFMEMGVSASQLLRRVKSEMEDMSQLPIKREKQKSALTPSFSTSSVVKQQKQPIGDAERNLINLNNVAAEGKIDEFYTSDNELYPNLFSTFSKRYNNNVVVTGKHGVGKTAFVRHIANLLRGNKVPEPFKGKVLLQVDFNALLVGTMYRGSFEAKIKPIIDDARAKDKYIFFIDDINSIIDNRKFTDIDIPSVIDSFLEEKNIPVICTSSDNGYSSMMSENPSIGRKLQKMALDEPSVEETVEILENSKERLELYHNVKYLTDITKLCARMCKQYISDKALPESAIDILDEVGAKLSIERSSNNDIETLNEQLDEVSIRINSMKSAEMVDYNILDNLVRREISLKSALAQAKKKISISAPATIVNVDDIRRVISYKTKIPLQEISVNERDKLRNMEQTLKEVIIGQDEAIDSVCKVVKRQRVGLSNPSKPSVFLFSSSTGVGKTLLAKKLAEKVFGSEKYLVRLDMSEYSDKTSTNKLIGAGSGYVGYEKGGVLTEAIKQKKYCVLLLDEIEKAHDEVHNMFLQMFDDGRMTDNHGVEVDFKNVIVIMTSNVGAAQAQARGGGVGFVSNKAEMGRSIMNNELKKKFKPEFLNRIDKVIYFNRLEGENLRKIVMLEIAKVAEKIRNIGYDLDQSVTEGEMVDNIFTVVKEQSEFGARPIIREVQTQIEDKITDLIIDGGVKDGHVFTATELKETI